MFDHNIDANLTHPDYCNDSEVFVKSTAIKIALVVEILVGALSVFGNGLLIVAVWRVSLFNANLRWLLINLSLNLLWYGGATAIKGLHFLVIACMGDPCLVVVQMLNCKIWEMAFITPFLNTIYSIMAVGIERLLSTARYHTYDSFSKRPWIAIVFIAAIWIGTLGNQIAVLATLPYRLLPICMSFLFTPTSTIRVALATNTALEVIGLLLISILYIWNLRKRDRAVNVSYQRRGYSLASRFAIIQNVNVNKLLLPSIIAHACAHVPYSIFLMLLLLGFELSIEVKVLFMHCSFVWFVAYGTTHAWLAFSRHPQLKAKFTVWAPEWLIRLSVIRHSRKIESYNPSATTEAHFDMLSKLWAAKPGGGCVPPISNGA